MKVLNLYAGIGGNRKLWTGVDVTAVEIRPDIAKVYSDHFPDDKLIIGDAHDYLLKNYDQFDFIWTSAPCPSHSRANFWASKTAGNRKKYYPDMTLYQEILFLKHWFKGKWLAENVIPYYEPLIAPDKKIGRHLFWSNFDVPDFNGTGADIHKGSSEEWIKTHGFDLSDYKIEGRKDQVYRNCVHPETGLHIFNSMCYSVSTKPAQTCLPGYETTLFSNSKTLTP
jgi:DNA (cytosine-5)-methyltransferase 1